jgi:uncharacterized protein (TIGR01777 family)
MKNIIIAGGTGFIGRYVTTRFREMGYNVSIISRNKSNENNVSWKQNDLINAFENSDLVLNLSGKSINCRHNFSNRKAIIESRINTTNAIGNAIRACKNPPKTWINASATGIYKPSQNKAMTENEMDLGSDFLSEVVRKWENTFFEFKTNKTRLIALRTSVVIGNNGGALRPLVWLSRLGLGGKQAIGNQIFSWIHIEDYFKVLLFILHKDEISGIINCTAPHPLSNKDFMKILRKTVHAPFGIPAPKFAINIGAKIIGMEPELLLNSSYIIPLKLNNLGFKFIFPNMENALSDLL